MSAPCAPQRAGSGSLRAALFAAAALLLTTGVVRAQQQFVPTADDTRSQVERLERELQELKARLQTGAAAPADGGAAPGGGGAPAAPAKKEEEKKPTEYTVGDILKLNVTWDNGGFRFKTDDEAFSIHIGGRMMHDEVWWKQSPVLRASPTPPTGSPLPLFTGVGPGIGDLTDGYFFRRIRFVADGQIWKTIEFKGEFDFENYTSLTFDEVYVGARDLPFIDTFRIGQMHVPFGLEAYSSSRWLPQFERSPLFDAFYQEFAPGIFTNTTFLDQRVTMQGMFHRIDNFNQFNGASFGDGKYAYSSRMSVLPIYEYEGRCLLHLGIAYQWRKGSIPSDFNGGTTLPSNPNPLVTTNTDLVRFRARQSLRDATGLEGDGNRVIDTGNIIADHVQSVNGEFLAYWGPFWVQSETNYTQVDNVVYPASAAGTRRSNLNYWGIYAQFGCFLTGEKRGYDRRFGKYDRVVPNENFFLVRDENGHAAYGLGAWELTYRYSWIDLDSDNVLGGRYGEHTFGVNWYWNSNIKIQTNYVLGQRLVPAPASSGIVQGFGLRAALEF
jgi:phosphate-selective porin OprO and OprP